MNALNEVIAVINDTGLRTDVYSTINSISMIIALLFGVCNGKKMRVGIIAVVVAAATYYVLNGPLATFILFVENGFTSTGKQNGVVIFPYIPLIGFLLSKILRKSWKEIWDVMMVLPLTMFAGARIACTVAGCCRGYPFAWGIYNVKTKECVFPIQLVESLVSILILVYVFHREKKNGFVPDGRNVPIILISYGIARFFLEFLHDNQKIVLGLASTQFHCILMIIIGVITLEIIRRSEKKERHDLPVEQII